MASRANERSAGRKLRIVFLRAAVEVRPLRLVRLGHMRPCRSEFVQLVSGSRAEDLKNAARGSDLQIGTASGSPILFFRSSFLFLYIF